MDTDWLEIRDDPSANVLLFQDRSLLQVSQEMDELDRSVESLLDTSVEIRNIATEFRNQCRGYGTVGTVIVYNTCTA